LELFVHDEVSVDHACAVLVEQSEREDRTLVGVAAEVVEWARSGARPHRRQRRRTVKT
jgi:hypothetical protein